MPMPEVEAVIFDLGRVMVTIDPLRPGFAALMHAIGVRPEDAFRRFWREPAVLAHNTGTMSPTKFYHVVREQFGLDWSEEEFRAAWCDLFTPMPGMEALFRRVAAQRTVGVLSDTDPLHWAHILALLPDLKRAAATLSFQAGVTKPAPRIYALAAAGCGVSPERCLFIDDLEDNVVAARRCGMKAVWFTGTEKLESELAAAEVLV